MTDEAPATGDRPAPQGSPPILVDTSRDLAVPAPQGDRVVAGTVSLVRDDARRAPTAGEYRAAGYGVPDHGDGPVPDDQTPGLVYADQRAPEGTVILASAPTPHIAIPDELVEPEPAGASVLEPEAQVAPPTPTTAAGPKARHGTGAGAPSVRPSLGDKK